MLRRIKSIKNKNNIKENYTKKAKKKNLATSK